MNRNMFKKTRTLTALLILSLLLCSCTGQKEESLPETTEKEPAEVRLSEADVKAGTVLRAEKREESVQIKADAAGVPQKITSEILLSGISPGTAEGRLFVRDVCDLTGIRNKEGDEDWVTDGKSIFWEYKGEDIRYEGTSERECPFGVKVSYYLDGKEVKPEELPGVSGKLKIRFDYSNATGEKGAFVPAAAMTAVFLPEKNFSDVEIENGTLISMANQNAAVGLAFPGLTEQLGLSGYEPAEDVEIPEYVEIRAKVTDFKLSFTATVFTTGLFAGLEDEDLEEWREIPKDMDELSDASKELSDGVGELYDGVEELKDGAEEYFDGVHSMKKGVKKLKEGTAALVKNSAALNKGAAEMEKGLKQLKEGLAGVDVSGLTELSKLDLSKLTEGLSKVDLKALADQLEPGVGKEQADQLRALQTSLTGLSKAAGQMQKLTKGAKKLAGSVTSLKKGVNGLFKGSTQLKKGLKAYTKGVAAVDQGTGELYSGAKKLDDAGKDLQDALTELLNGVGELKDGVKEFDEEGIKELDKLAGDQLRKILDNVTVLRDNDAGYDSFSASELTEGTEGSVRFIIETAEIK